MSDALSETVLSGDSDIKSIMSNEDKKLEKIYETQVKPYLD